MATKEQHHANPSESFRWDWRGNPVSDERQHSAPGNRLAFYADRHFEYDRFGNLIAERRGKDHKLVTRYAYDCRHRLIRHETPNGSVSTYTYDAFNRRLSKTVNGKLLEFVWRGNQLVAETDGKGYWQSYLYEPGSYRPMVLVVGEPSRDPQDKPPAIYWYQNDHLGTPHELTDWNGNSVWKGRFSAFGQIREEWLAEDASTINQPLRFQGQYADKESGFYYNLNRYYDPGIGRYLTADPVKLIGGENSYRYCTNPVSWIDPLGLKGLPGGESSIGKVPDGVPLSQQKFDEIINTPKGQRPDPNSYLPQEYIDAHLAQFRDGASRIVSKKDFEKYGIGKPDNGKTEFVSTKSDIDALLKESNGNINNVATALGIPSEQITGTSLLRVDLVPTSKYNLRLPSGNEFGANSQWLPGGKLPTGKSEAVVPTEGMQKGIDYKATDLKTGENL